ncbi:MAG: porin [Gammaproteobacteria bacterium]|nr:porin [Gammaproteobacteria bacterium]
MNFRKTAVATAVGATLAFSGVAQADGHETSFYGRINNAYDSGDLSGDDRTDLSGISSRFGFKGSAPINDDWSAHGRYEFGTVTDSEGVGVTDTRLAYVGVTGADFGTINVGNQWSTFYNMVGTHLDPTVSLGYYLYSSAADLPYRVSNAIQYSNSFGMVNVSAEIRLNEDGGADVANGTDHSKGAEKIGENDGHAIGISFMPIEGLTLAVAVDSQDGVGTAPDEDRTGYVAKYAMDNWWVSFGIGETDYDGDAVEQTQIHAGASFGDGMSAFIGIGEVEADGISDELEGTTLNFTKVFGSSGFRLYWEYVDLELGSDSGDRQLLGARIDF